VQGTENILEQALDLGVKKLLYTSSCAVFGPSYKVPICEKDPRTIGYGNDYDLSKCLAESKVREYSHRGLFAMIVNPSRVYGAGLQTTSNAITAMLLKGLRGHMIFIPGCSRVISNYAFIDDVVKGHILAMQKGISGEQYILGGENISYGEFYKLISNLISRPRLIKLSSGILKGLGWIQSLRSTLTGIEPLFTSSIINRYLNNMSVSSSKAIRQLNYQITPFREGIQNTILKLQNAMDHE
jgi:nucleoside-diphosphate-sugar epimerase